ncbi:hypothetical protein EMIT043CA1_10124 [Pseudomonas brassicacearum]
MMRVLRNRTAFCYRKVRLIALEKAERLKICDNMSHIVAGYSCLGSRTVRLKSETQNAPALQKRNRGVS